MSFTDWHSDRDFFVFSGDEIWPNSQWNLSDFFPILKTKSQSSKKKFFFLKIGIFIQSTHRRYMVTFSFNLMAIECIVNFLLINNDIIVHFKKFLNFRGLPC